MSNIKKPCNGAPCGPTKLVGFNETAGQVMVDPASLPGWPTQVACDVIKNCPTILDIQADIVNNRAKIKEAKDIAVAADTESKKIDEKLAPVLEKNTAQDKMLEEINTNITMLKGWNTKQDSKLKAIEVRAIRDTVYNNFVEWCENVYIPKFNAGTAKFYRGTLYMNVSTSLAAINATYVNVRGENDTTPASAEDWQKLPFTAPADMLTVLGVDPLEVEHPDKHTWVLKVDPVKLRNVIQAYERLDLSRTIVALNEIAGETKFKEAATFEKEINVKKVATLQDAVVEDNFESKTKAVFNDMEIRGRVLKPTTFAEDMHITESLNVDNNIGCDDLKVKEMTTLNHAFIQDLKIPGYTNNLQWIIADLYSKIR